MKKKVQYRELNSFIDVNTCTFRNSFCTEKDL